MEEPSVRNGVNVSAMTPRNPMESSSSSHDYLHTSIKMQLLIAITFFWFGKGKKKGTLL
jgi:hypothetical protein